MFTGIVEEVGTVDRLTAAGGDCRIAVRAALVLENTRIGDSIAVNGVCLTVTDMRAGEFRADVSAETLRRSVLGQLNRGAKVNLERAAAVGARLGGHIVSGHIDGVGRLIRREPEGGSELITIGAPDGIMDLIVEKGSVAVDGISLTVAALGRGWFQVAVIPHTSGETTLMLKKPGDPVNLENDIIGKYVQKLMGKEPCERNGEGITMEWLNRYGFGS